MAEAEHIKLGLLYFLFFLFTSPINAQLSVDSLKNIWHNSKEVFYNQIIF